MAIPLIPNASYTYFRWFKHISDVAEAYNKKEGKSRKLEPAPDAEEPTEVLQELPGAKEATAERSEHGGEAGNDSEGGGGGGAASNRNSDVIDEEDGDRHTNGESAASSHNGKRFSQPLRFRRIVRFFL